MNDLQKKLLIVGITAFIVWLLMAFEGNSFNYIGSGFSFFYQLDWIISHSIYGHPATWIQTLTFTTWLGSLIAFNVYQD